MRLVHRNGKLKRFQERKRKNPRWEKKGTGFASSFEKAILEKKGTRLASHEEKGKSDLGSVEGGGKKRKSSSGPPKENGRGSLESDDP